MRTKRVFHAVDSHTEGMPTRVITGGVGVIPGASMAERRVYFRDHLDHIRRLLMNEPRGHAAMSGAILQPPTRPDADWGVLFIEVSGLLPMCGHGTIGVATVLVETGMVEVVEPVTTVRLEVPAGLVEVDVAVEDGMAMSVTLRNVPAYCDRLDAVVTVPGFGDIRYDLAYGGNFYAIVDLDDYGLPFDRKAKNEILAAGLATMAAIDAADEPVHPEDDRIRGCHHVYFAAPGSDAHHSRHAMAIYPGWFDRSPCGTGTSARMAQLHARGQLAVSGGPGSGEFVNESFIGTRFIGRLLGETTVGGRPAVVPAITGRAWVTGTAQYFLDPRDPFPEGFEL
ncbi:proline racemase family protein [Nonomuraea aurantiaca]|uniref:proline racemase family protein n=1 Tax=Nonomuraea aurantiaca TaxID=2878562 RepID=UPI001CD9E0EA|nr:proline racemase family protein [Nonomuraea aurantiaca]MCA2222283.1 proline racemase family protein [Nonomuraea aurantiaca]